PQELDRADSPVTDGTNRLGCAATDPFPLFGCERGGGSFFQHLLEPALKRAIALAEVDGGSMVIGEYLNLDVARAIEVAFQVNGVGSEIGSSFPAGDREGAFEVVGPVGSLHALAATAAGGLDQDRIADLGGQPPGLGVGVDRAIAAGDDRKARGNSRPLGGDL